jgi:hypothetical protein
MGVCIVRLPNHKLNTEISAFKEFDNYNLSILGRRSGNTYTITHWNTKVLEYDLSKNEIVYLYETHFSQTTSALVGRIIRSLPASAVMAFIEKLDSKPKQRRFVRMLGIY